MQAHETGDLLKVVYIRNVECLLTRADKSNLYAELVRVRQSMYFRFSAAYFTYMIYGCYMYLSWLTGSWLQRYPPRKSSAKQLVANAFAFNFSSATGQTLCFAWLGPGDLIGITEYKRRSWASLERISTCKRTPMLRQARGWKMKMNIQTI